MCPAIFNPAQTAGLLFFNCLRISSSLIPFNRDFNLCVHFCCSFVTHMIPHDTYEKAHMARID